MPPHIIPVFIPFAGCPHQCVFCNQRAITGAPATLPAPEELARAVATGRARARPQRFPVEIAFFGGNFLGLAPDQRYRLLDAAEALVRCERVHSIRFSTRPDTVTAASLAGLAGYTVGTVELGVQSMHDAVLKTCRRNHTAAHTSMAVRLLRNRGCRLGLQLMVGLPGDTPDRLAATGAAVTALAPDFVRIYPTLVFEGSALAEWVRQGSYRPLTLEEALDSTWRLFLQFSRHDIAVARMGLQPPPGGFAAHQHPVGPWHPAFGELVIGRVLSVLAQDILTHDLKGCKHVVLRVHPRHRSALCGHNRRHLQALQAAAPHTSLSIVSDAALGPTELVAVDRADATVQGRRDWKHFKR